MNTVKFPFRGFPLLCCLIGAAAAPPPPLDPFPVSWEGTGALRSGLYREAIDTLKKKKHDPDPAFRLFKLGLAYAGDGDTVKAVRHLYDAALKDSALAPLAWEYMADIGIGRKNQADSALACYGRAIFPGMPNKMRLRIFEKIQAAVNDDTAKIRRWPFFPDYLQWTARKKAPAPPDPGCILADSLIRSGLWAAVDSFINRTLTALPDSAQCAIVDAIARAQPPDTLLSTPALFLLARLAMDCRQHVTAEQMLSIAQGKKDFGTVVSAQRLMRFRGRLYFSEKKYDDAIRTFKTYINRYGNENDILLLIARSYRILDSVERCARWYDRYIAQNRKAAGLSEILWRRAWMELEMGNPANALRFFRWIHQAFPKSQRADESCYREALCRFQIDQFDSAHSVLNFLEKKYSGSSLLSSTGYWKAKCLVNMDKTEKARMILADVSRREPTDYYSHRARALLTLLGDSVNSLLRIDTVDDQSAAVQWLDSIVVNKKALSSQDSLTLRRGTICAAIGAFSDAEMFLESVEFAHPGNLELEFRIAGMYRDVGALPQASRSGRRFSWRIPLGWRSQIPFPVYSLMFPRYYDEHIKRETARWNIDPCLVFAVIRQESVFNPDALSPVGAIGLMQIMPYTGKAIAQNLKEQFFKDSLRIPAVNIRYGTYYLRELLDQFNENEVLALASYNGGPHNTKRWLLRNGEMDMDLFIEHIGFAETRTYVKKVLANYWFYKRLLRVSPL